MLWTISACYGRYHCPPRRGPAARPAPPAHPGWVVSGWVTPAAGPAGGVVRDRSSDATGGHGAELEPVESGDVRRRALVEHNEHMLSAETKRGRPHPRPCPSVRDAREYHCSGSAQNRRQSGLECEALAA